MALAPDVLAGLSVQDLEYRYLGVLGAAGLHIDDRRFQIYGENEHAYFAGLSGLTPAQEFMLPDHRLAYYKTQTGLTSGTLADVARAFWGAGI